jgi:preprotein translocase subunit YajC
MISEAHASAEYFMSGYAYQGLAVLAFILLFYFLLLRPQQKRVNEHKELLKLIEVGNEVVTVGGFLGTITKIDNDGTLDLKLNEGIEVRIQKAAIESIVGKKPSS